MCHSYHIKTLEKNDRFLGGWILFFLLGEIVEFVFYLFVLPWILMFLSRCQTVWFETPKLKLAVLHVQKGVTALQSHGCGRSKFFAVEQDTYRSWAKTHPWEPSPLIHWPWIFWGSKGSCQAAEKKRWCRNTRIAVSPWKINGWNLKMVACFRWLSFPIGWFW